MYRFCLLVFLITILCSCNAQIAPVTSTATETIFLLAKTMTSTATYTALPILTPTITPKPPATLTPTPSGIATTTTAKSEHRCGDGVCDGPETVETCPNDCQQPQTSSPESTLDTPPLYFFYAIHAHGSDDFLPYTDSSMITVNPEIADNMIAAIEGIAEVLDKYGVKGTWEFLPATTKGIISYQGENNVFDQLLSKGHEIGAHAHRVKDVPAAVQTLQDYCGISPQTSSGFIAQISKVGLGEAQRAMSEAIEVPVNLGLTVGTTNLSPGGGKNLLSTTCKDEVGVGNNMWMDTGNLMFPWHPDYINDDICSDNRESEMIFIDHVSIEWLLLPEAVGPPDVLDNRHFNQLKEQFDAALNYMEVNRPERIAAWGFVTHIIEYAIGGKGENPPDPAALEALNDFLSYVDSKHNEGLLIYATAAKIANQVSTQAP